MSSRVCQLFFFLSYFIDPQSLICHKVLPSDPFNLTQLSKVLHGSGLRWRIESYLLGSSLRN